MHLHQLLSRDQHFVEAHLFCLDPASDVASPLIRKPRHRPAQLAPVLPNPAGSGNVYDRHCEERETSTNISASMSLPSKHIGPALIL